MKGSAGSKLYFPNLDGLRAIGASIVMIGHVDFIHVAWGLPSMQWFPVAGKVGVALFFSLSGFLITSLLLLELENTKTIRLKDFYVRRILRIWPLYYLLIALCILVINRIGFFKIPLQSDELYNNMTWLNLLNVLLIIPNFTHFNIPYSYQRWSIIVEEQFYFIQPALIRIFRRRSVLLVLFVGIVFSSELVTGLLRVTGLYRHLSEGVISSILEQLKYLGCIAVGCIGSVLYYRRDPGVGKILFSVPVQVVVTALIIFGSFWGFYVAHSEEYFDYRLFCVLFTIVVLNAALNPATIFRLEYPLLKFLGRISYGIYMYHLIGIGAAWAIVRGLTRQPVLQNLCLYLLSVAFTILLAWLSYEYFESFFLKLKSKIKFPVRRGAVSH